jgi:hypothetical protein
VSQTKPGPDRVLGPEAREATRVHPSRHQDRHRPDLFARLQSALPLLVVYFLFATLYAWQASRRPVPTIFTDELELTQLSRAIAATGEAARRGEPFGQLSLLPYLLAPVWWLGKTTAAYATAKVVLVLMMTAAVFPAYGIARLVVPRWYALAAAAASIAIPAMAYSPILVKEPLAYPLSTLALLLIARLLVHPTWKGAALALAVSGAAALTRTQLAILFVVFALAVLWLAWDSEPGRRWRDTFSTWDWVGGVVLLIGIAVVFSALVGHLSQSWAITTKAYKGRIFDHATWALGALAIGVGVLPLILGLAALARPRGEPRTRGTTAFVVTSVVALGVFLWYAGIKGAYLSTVFSTIVAERDLIYLAPILFAGTALTIHRGAGRWWAIAVAAAVTVFVVQRPPLHLTEYPYYEAHGLEIAAFANRELGWSEDGIRRALWVVCILAVALAVAFKLLRRGSRAFRAVAATSAVLVLGWSLTTEVYAARGETHLSRQIDDVLPRPLNWVDDATRGGSVVVIGQGITDPTGIQETEIFNKSFKKLWSIDGTAIKAGAPVLTPNLQAADGTLWPPPGTKYALALNGVELQAPLVRQVGSMRLYRLPEGPLKLAAAVTGIQSDGWMAAPDASSSATASYTRYDVAHDGAGLAVVTLSRVASCPKTEAPGRVTVKIGPVGVSPDQEPKIARVTAVKRGLVKPCSATGFSLSVPNRPWRMEVSIKPTFVPQEVDPVRFSDRRHLGAVVTRIGFQPLFGG